MPRPAPHTPNLDSVTTINADGSRYFIHPADVRGRWTFLRRASGLLLIALYAALPWIRVNGQPAVFLDVAHRQFHFFGYTLAPQDLWLLFFLITVVQLSDVLQYVAGKLFGRTRLAPNVSPSKTVEGLVIGGLAATAVGAGLWWITPFQPHEAAIMAFAIVVAGALGGLVLSAVKRSLGAKDWGVMIQGHGGALDRMDSVTFAAPLFFHLTHYFFAN